MNNIYALSRLILVNGLRGNFIIGLVVFSLSCEVASLYFMNFFPHDIGRISADFIISISFIAGVLFLFFYAVQLISIDEEHKAIYLFLARPLSRGHYVLGVFLGCSFLLLLLNFVLASTGYGLLYLIKSLVSDAYFPNLSASSYGLSFIGLISIELMILAVIILIASVIRSGFLVMLLALSYYLICNGLPIVRESLQQQREVPLFLISLTKWLTLVFPDFEKYDYKYLVTGFGVMPDISQMMLNGGYFISYIAVILIASIAIYNKRDLL